MSGRVLCPEVGGCHQMFLEVSDHCCIFHYDKTDRPLLQASAREKGSKGTTEDALSANFMLENKIKQKNAEQSVERS